MEPFSSVETTPVMRESAEKRYPSGMPPGCASAAASASITRS